MQCKELVGKANKLFKNGEYERARLLYEKACRDYGFAHLAFNVELCLKRISSESGSHNNKKSGSKLNSYFDHVYVVNLQSAVQDRLKVSFHLKKKGVEFELFEAVNGYEGEAYSIWSDYIQKPLGSLVCFPDLNEREVKRKKKFIESAGAIGYILTYIKVLRDAKSRGFEKIVILEDDVILSNEFESALERFISSVGNDWKILQLGASQYNWSSVDEVEAAEKGFYFPRKLDTCGSFALCIDCSIVDELIELESSMEVPFDHASIGTLYEKYLGKCFVANPNIVMPDVGTSTIRGGRDQYSHGVRMRWQLDKFPYPLARPSLSLVIRCAKNFEYLSPIVKTNLPFELRVFYLSNDGLRPVHDIDSIPQGDLPVADISNIRFPKSDFYAQATDRYPVSERDLVCFVEGLISGRFNSVGNLRHFCAISKDVIRGQVSTIIPTYKRPTNLRAAVESVAKQDYENKQIIIVSDNGFESDYNLETRAVVSQIKKDFCDIDIVYLEHSVNRNGAAARNSGLMESTGEYVTFLDDDDIYLDGRLAKSISELEKSRSDTYANYCGFLGWNSPVNDEARYVSDGLIELILCLEFKKHYLHTNTATYRSCAIYSINGFDESYGRHQDLEFNLRFLAQYRMGVCREALVRLNPAPSDISNKLFGMRLVDVKKKLLDSFIGFLDPSRRSDAYVANWREVMRYVDNPSFFRRELEGRLENAEAQILRFLD